MMFMLGQNSRANLVGVHPDLKQVVARAIQLTEVDFGVSDGVRTIEEQRYMVDIGASKTMDSRHLTGHAVDLFAYVGGKARWELPFYHIIAEAMKTAATELDVDVEWGYDLWEWDAAHFQLPHQMYPGREDNPVDDPFEPTVNTDLVEDDNDAN